MHNKIDIFNMKAILEFDLDNPDDKQAHLRCVKSFDMACVLFELEKNLKTTLLHITDNISEIEGVDKTIEEIDTLFEIHNINMDELINLKK